VGVDQPAQPGSTTTSRRHCSPVTSSRASTTVSSSLVSMSWRSNELATDTCAVSAVRATRWAERS
jgi:hypothetical protein